VLAAPAHEVAGALDADGIAAARRLAGHDRIPGGAHVRAHVRGDVVEVAPTRLLRAPERSERGDRQAGARRDPQDEHEALEGGRRLG
jgi:hypothetical protein